jgi:hypothetical protein
LYRKQEELRNLEESNGSSAPRRGWCRTTVLGPPRQISPRDREWRLNTAWRITNHLPATLRVLVVLVVLHLSGGRDGHGRAGNRAGCRVNDWDRIASALSQWLVKLHLLSVLEAREVVRVRDRRQHKGRRRLSLLLNW